MIRQIISQDKNLITYRPALRSIGGSITGTVLLQQIIFWDDVAGGKFYKFAEPPKDPRKQPMYKAGDSWREELGMSAKELRTALNHFAFKCGAKNKSKFGEEYDIKRSSAVVQYYTDSQRVTWYMLNRDVLNKLLLGIYKETDQSDFTNTETTTETTTDTNTEDKPPAESVESSNKKPLPPSSRNNDVAAAFDLFWSAYPKKKSKGAARKAFAKAIKCVEVSAMITAIKSQKVTEGWTKEGGQFIPYPASWLNAEGWEDEVAKSSDGYDASQYE